MTGNTHCELKPKITFGSFSSSLQSSITAAITDLSVDGRDMAADSANAVNKLQR